MQLRVFLIEITKPVDGGRACLNFVKEQQCLACYNRYAKQYGKHMAYLLWGILPIEEVMHIMPFVEIHLGEIFESLSKVMYRRGLAHLSCPSEKQWFALFGR